MSGVSAGSRHIGRSSSSCRSGPGAVTAGPGHRGSGACAAGLRPGRKAATRPAVTAATPAASSSVRSRPDVNAAWAWPRTCPARGGASRRLRRPRPLTAGRCEPPGRAGPAAGEASPRRRSGRCRPAAPPRWRRRPGGTCWPPRTQRAESPRPARVPRAARLAGRGRIRGNPGAAAAAAAVVLWAAAAVSVTVITFTSSPPASAVTARTSGGAPAVASTPANMKGDPRDDRPLRNNGTVSGATWSFCRSRGGSRPTYSCVRYQVGREPGIGPAQLTCPNTDTDHSDQSVPVLFAPLFLKGRRGAGRGL